MHLIKLEKDKTIIPSKNITYYLNPDYVYIPVRKYNVKQNEYVYKNQVIGYDKEISPISGKVIGIKKCLVNNTLKNTLVIENDFREYSKSENKKSSIINIPSIIKHLKDEKKLLDKFKSSEKFTSIIINAIDDEPYVYNNIYLLKEEMQELLTLIDNLRLIYKTEDNLLVIKNSDAYIIDECLNILGSFPSIKLTLVMDEYLLEEEKFITEKLEIKSKYLYLSIKDLKIINDLLKGTKKTTKLITIAGDAIKKSKIIRLKAGTLLGDVIRKYIDIKEENINVVVNGLMKGYLINNLDNFIITDEIKSISIMKKQKKYESECIKCGKCIMVCPFNVNRFTHKNEDKCINCGLCSYICPSNINLRKEKK